MTKRLLLSLVSIAAVAGLVAGGTLALFSDETPGEASFTAGTVKLGETTHFDCTLPELWAPGDEVTCNFKVKYDGNLDAYVGVLLEGTGALFDSEYGIDFAVPGAIVDGHGVYMLGKFAPGAEIPITINIKFPLAAGNDLQGAEGSVAAALKAVQARNNDAGNVPIAWE